MDTLNIDCHLQMAHELHRYPHFVSEETRWGLARHDCILWVKNQVSGIWFPWLISREMHDHLKDLLNDWSLLTVANVEVYRQMGLVYDLDEVLRQKTRFDQRIREEAVYYRVHGYCILPNILIPTYHNTINYYMRQAADLLVPDNQTDKRLGRHNLPLFAALHDQLTFLVQRVLDAPIKRSYCYAVTYTKGAVLPVHTDRPQCEWNASITFAKDDDKPWLIWLDRDGIKSGISAEIGEAIVYRGTKIPHWRKELESEYATVAFYHFVPQSFKGELN